MKLQMFKVSISLHGEDNRGGSSFLLISVPALIFARIGIKEWIGDVGLEEKASSFCNFLQT